MGFDRLPFYNRCVEWDNNLIDQLDYLQSNAEPITRQTFLRHVDREQFDRISQRCGYAKHHMQGLTMAADHHVTYHRCGDIYYFCWSAIEYVFARPSQIAALVSPKDEP